MALTDNLSGFWKLDDASGSSVADATGTGHTGTWQGTLGSQWGTGKIGGCGVFNGTNNYVDLGSTNALRPTAAITIAAWVNPSVASYPLNAAVLKCGSATAGYSLEGRPLRLWLNLTNGFGWVNSGAAPALSASTWTHIVGTYDGVTLKIYSNGSLSSSLAKTAVITQAVDNISIGRDSDNPSDGSRFWQGSLDEVGLWSRALSSTEVTSLYNSGNGIAYPFSTGSSHYYNQLLSS